MFRPSIPLILAAATLSAFHCAYNICQYQDTANMQQEDFIRAQSAQAQADQGQTQQQNPSMQNPNVQNQYMQNANVQNLPMPQQPMQYPNPQTPGAYTQDPNVQNAYTQHPNSQQQNPDPYTQNQRFQPSHAQYPQGSRSLPPNPQGNPREGDFTYNGQTYNIHALHALIDARHPNSPQAPNRGPQAFALPSNSAFGPHNAPPAPPPRLGPNGRQMIWMDKFGYRGEWVETPDSQAYRREDEEGRAERERDLAAQLEFVERNPHRLGNTWRPSWRRW